LAGQLVTLAKEDKVTGNSWELCYTSRMGCL